MSGSRLEFAAATSEQEFRLLDSSLLHGYARLSSSDWQDGFPQLSSHDADFLTPFEVEVEQLRVPGSNLQQNFFNRIASTMIACHVVVGSIASTDTDLHLVASVARGMNYRSRLTRTEYVYVPDLLVLGNDPQLGLETLHQLSMSLGNVGKGRVVVDSYASSTKHRAMLEQMSLEPGKKQTWPTPPFLVPFVGETYDVQQYKGHIK